MYGKLAGKSDDHLVNRLRLLEQIRISDRAFNELARGRKLPDLGPLQMLENRNSSDQLNLLVKHFLLEVFNRLLIALAAERDYMTIGSADQVHLLGGLTEVA